MAASGTRGGIKIGFTQTDKKYPVQLSSEKAYVEVPWTDTTYTAGTGLSLDGTTINHSNSITGTSVGPSANVTDRSVAVPQITFDNQGHITATNNRTFTVNSTTIREITIQTGDTKKQSITLETLMTWLITTQQYIPSNTDCHVVLKTTWAYANNDILKLTCKNALNVDTNYELQLAGVIIEFIGKATNYNTGVFRLIIHSSPTTSFTPTTNYTIFPVNHIAEYTCNGSGFTPAWKMITVGGDIEFDNSTTTQCLTKKGTWANFTNNSGTITKVTTSEGAHTTINISSGAVSFNVPTKTSHLTNDSGFLTAHQTIKQDGITGAEINRFGTCDTAAATAAKTVNITTGTFALAAGSIVAVKFTNTNTANNPTLNVNSKGAKNIWVNGARITSGANKALLQGTVVFVYDGTQWNLIGNYYDTDTTYTFAESSTNGKFTVTPNGGSPQEVPIHGLGTAAYTASTAYATSTHAHGNITKDGTITSDTTRGSGDKLVIIDADNNKVARSNIPLSATVSSQSQTTKFLREDGAWAAPTYTTNAITGVKGNAETNYRTGNVNLTPANIGALALSGGGTVTNTFCIKNTSVDASKSNNNVTSTLYTNYHFYDNASHICGSMRPVYFTGGDIALQLIARNWSAPETGDSVQMASGGFTITANKNGNLGVVLDNSHTATSVKNIIFTIGNNKGNGTASSNDGVLRLYGKGTSYAQFYDSGNKLTDNRTYQLPDANGTMALREDLNWKGPVNIGTSSTNISSYSDYNELYFVAILDTTNKIYATMTIPMIEIKRVQNAQRIFRSGWYQAGTNGGEFDIMTSAIASTGTTTTWDIRAWGSARMNTSAVSSPDIKMYYR